MAVLAVATTLPAAAQGLRSRITRPIESSGLTVLAGTHPPRARAIDDVGVVDASKPLSGMEMVFAPSAAQQQEMQALIAAQQDPSSALYHQWLTPEQFGARFGMSDADLATVESWLGAQGFTVQGVARGRNRIEFSGTAGEVGSAFHTSLHYYRNQQAASAGGAVSAKAVTVAGEQAEFAPSTDISLPSAIAGTVTAVTNLSSFHPRARVRQQGPEAVKPSYTSSQTGNHFLTPADLATVYDITPAYNAGFTGKGQTIAVVGQSLIVAADITNFQKAEGLPSAAPTMVLVPNSGTGAVYTSDESESDLDIEYSGAIAKGATVDFVYTGNDQNKGTFDAINYAIEEKLAPIISDSYGECEPVMGAAMYASYDQMLAQGATQGQTVIAPSGDSGSEDCYGESGGGVTTAETTGLAVDFPASSEYATGMGGTEFSAANVAAGNTTYWLPEGSTDTLSSATGYIPEQVWNDNSAANGLSAGGGGVSIFTQRPSWQTGVPGIPSGTYRLVPDLSLAASPTNPGYLYCSSDSKSTGVTGSCANGFRDSNDEYFTVAGGTSFAAPIFAGMLAVINQAKDPTGQGLINPTLYTLASNANTYQSAFHDVTVGNNECTLGGTTCSTAGAGAYAAGVGYDEASGLGSVDFANLLTAWPGSTASTLAATTTTVTAATTTPALGATDAITITVAPASGLGTPTGTINVTVDGTSVNSNLQLSGGTATYTFSSQISGSHVIVATYSGDGMYASSSGSVALTLPAAPPTASEFTIAASPVTVTAGSTGTSTVTVTPVGGYSGTVQWKLTPTPALANSCFNLASVKVSGGTPATATLTIYTSSSACTTLTPLNRVGGQVASGTAPPRPGRRSPKPVEAMLAGLLLIGFLGRRSRKLRPMLGVSVLLLGGLAVTLGIAGCGGNSGTTNTTIVNANAAAGTYTLTLTGTDASNSTITASTTVTLTVN